MQLPFRASRPTGRGGAGAVGRRRRGFRGRRHSCGPALPGGAGRVWLASVPSGHLTSLLRSVRGAGGARRGGPCKIYAFSAISPEGSSSMHVITLHIARNLSVLVGTCPNKTASESAVSIYSSAPLDGVFDLLSPASFASRAACSLASRSFSLLWMASILKLCNGAGAVSRMSILQHTNRGKGLCAVRVSVLPIWHVLVRRTQQQRAVVHPWLEFIVEDAFGNLRLVGKLEGAKRRSRIVQLVSRLVSSKSAHYHCKQPPLGALLTLHPSSGQRFSPPFPSASKALPLTRRRWNDTHL